MQIHCFAPKCFSSLPPLASVALPSRRETHLWYITPNEVNDASLLAHYLELLSPSEKENVFSMRGEMLQRRALLARALIGIDVEEKERKIKNNLSSFARRYFTSDEVEYLHAIPDPEVQRQEFIKLWTLKEAYVKALGRGFSAAPFRSFAIRFKGITKSSLQVPDISSSKAPEIVVELNDNCDHLTTDWNFTLCELDSSHYAAICTEDKLVEGEERGSLNLKVWKTIPFVQDECVSGTNSVVAISGLT